MTATDFRELAQAAADRYGVATDVPDMPEERYALDHFDAVFEDDSYDAVREAGMGQAVAADADETRFLATDGLASCVGVVAYDADQGRGFVGHEVKNDAVDGRRPSIERFQERYDGDDLAVTYVVGNRPDDDVVATAVETMRSTAAELEERFIYTGRSGSVALDLRDGELYTYDGDEDPDATTLL